MQIAKRFGWILVGVVIGAVAPDTILTGQRRLERPGPERLQITGVGFYEGGQNFAFIKDAKSGGCWLLARGSQGSAESPVSLAPAPATACEPATP
jgi:hypothetical protein